MKAFMKESQTESNIATSQPSSAFICIINVYSELLTVMNWKLYLDYSVRTKKPKSCTILAQVLTRQVNYFV